jgi:hypothetical protein
MSGAAEAGFHPLGPMAHSDPRTLAGVAELVPGKVRHAAIHFCSAPKCEMRETLRGNPSGCDRTVFRGSRLEVSRPANFRPGIIGTNKVHPNLAALGEPM